jgi:hypothetical protein
MFGSLHPPQLGSRMQGTGVWFPGHSSWHAEHVQKLSRGTVELGISFESSSLHALSCACWAISAGGRWRELARVTSPLRAIQRIPSRSLPSLAVSATGRCSSSSPLRWWCSSSIGGVLMLPLFLFLLQVRPLESGESSPCPPPFSRFVNPSSWFGT